MSNSMMMSYHVKSKIGKYTPISLKKLGTYAINVKQEKDAPEKIQSFTCQLHTLQITTRQNNFEKNSIESHQTRSLLRQTLH